MPKKVKLFLDENMPMAAFEILKRGHYHVEHARLSHLKGAADKKIALHALNERAILITKDLEFGSLLLYPKGSHFGLLIVRLPNNFSAEKIAGKLHAFLDEIAMEELVGAITVLEIGRYRTRKLNAY